MRVAVLSRVPLRHVLLADDDAKLREAVRRMLEILECRVTEAGHGGEALAIHAQDPADILLTDIVMDGKEGLETIKAFRAQYPSVRVIAMSGGGVGSAATYLKMATHFGADTTLPKPFTMDQLRSALNKDS
jgi:DNA-binding NtrC family response regulator